MAKWNVVCRPKDFGGLGIHDLEVKNRVLLGKWLFKLLTEDGVWQTLLRRKYIRSSAVSQISLKPGDSHFLPIWFFLSIKDGSEIRSWEDKWLGTTPL